MARLGGKEMAVLAGRAHPYESGNPAVMRPSSRPCQAAGIETLILTNAAGSLEAEDAARLHHADRPITSTIAGMNPLIGSTATRISSP